MLKVLISTLFSILFCLAPVVVTAQTVTPQTITPVFFHGVSGNQTTTFGAKTLAGYGGYVPNGLSGALTISNVVPTGGGASTDFCVSTDFDGTTGQQIVLNGSGHTGGTCTTSDYGLGAHALATSYTMTVTDVHSHSANLTVNIISNESTVKSQYGFATHGDNGTSGNTNFFQLGIVLQSNNSAVIALGDKIVIRADDGSATSITPMLNPLSLACSLYSGSINTNAATASGSAVLNFASVPSWVTNGAIVTDTTRAGIPTGATVLSTTTTTVTMSANANSTAVQSGDTILFSNLTTCPTSNRPNTYNLYPADTGGTHLTPTTYAGQQPVAINSATYNNTTGLVTATLNSSFAASPGTTFTVGPLCSLGAIATCSSLFGVDAYGNGYGGANGTFAAGPGTGGTTLTWYISAGLNITFNSGTGLALLPITIECEALTTGNDANGNPIGGGNCNLGAMGPAMRNDYGSPTAPADITAVTNGPTPFFFYGITHLFNHALLPGEAPSQNLMITSAGSGTGTAATVSSGWTEDHCRYAAGPNVTQEEGETFFLDGVKDYGGAFTNCHFVGNFFGDIEPQGSIDNPGLVLKNNIFEGFLQNGQNGQNVYNVTIENNHYFGGNPPTAQPNPGNYFIIGTQLYLAVSGVPNAQGQWRLDPNGNYAQTAMNISCAIDGASAVINWGSNTGTLGSFDCNPAHNVANGGSLPSPSGLPGSGATAAAYAPTYSGETADLNVWSAWQWPGETYMANLTALVTGTAINTLQVATGSTAMATCNIIITGVNDSICTDHTPGGEAGWTMLFGDPSDSTTKVFGCGQGTGSPTCLASNKNFPIQSGNSSSVSGTATYNSGTGLVTIPLASPFVLAVPSAGFTVQVSGLTGTGSYNSANGTFTTTAATTTTSIVYAIATNLTLSFNANVGAVTMTAQDQFQMQFVHTDCIILVQGPSPPPTVVQPNPEGGFPQGRFAYNDCIRNQKVLNSSGDTQFQLFQDLDGYGMPRATEIGNIGFDNAGAMIWLSDAPNSYVCCNTTLEDARTLAYAPTDPSYDYFSNKNWITQVGSLNARLQQSWIGLSGCSPASTGCYDPGGSPSGGAYFQNLSNTITINAHTGITPATQTPNPNETVIYIGSPTDGNVLYNTYKTMLPNLPDTQTNTTSMVTRAGVIAAMTPVNGTLFTATTNTSTSMTNVSGWTPVDGTPLNDTPIGSCIPAGDLVASHSGTGPYTITLQTAATCSHASTFGTGVLNGNGTINGAITPPDSNSIGCQNYGGLVYNHAQTCAVMGTKPWQ